MFYALIIKQDEYGHSFTYPIREHGFLSLESAKKALDNSGLIGYVKKYGLNKPVYYRIAK
jgi:hypothetical protein